MRLGLFQEEATGKSKKNAKKMAILCLLTTLKTHYKHEQFLREMLHPDNIQEAVEKKQHLLRTLRVHDN